MGEEFNATSDERTKNNAGRMQYRVLSDIEKEHVSKIKELTNQLSQAIRESEQDGKIAITDEVESTLERRALREDLTHDMQLAQDRLAEASMWAVRGITAPR